ncbi:MAG: outer membrane beta-barrel protein [Bacteroidales bacterium]|nr:outer membrane beta-barrel protein [Bacteroidales bacterium]MDD4685572.1 outer membrane beta-barrel protein [Bacteroidales bacterium]
MKKTIVLVALIFVSLATIAQTSYGVRAGMSLSTYYSAQSIYQFKPGIHIGGVADIPIGSSKFSFVPGVYFADKGTKTEGYFPPKNVDFFVRPEAFDFKETHYNYQLEIPLLFTYKITLNEKLTLKPQIGAFVSYTMFERINIKRDYFYSIYTNPPSEISEDYYFYDDIYLGFGGNLGVSAFYNKYSFTLSCDVGYSNYEVTSYFYESEGNYPNICMFFSLGYNF